MDQGADAQKRRGAFYTPPNIARFLVRWAIRSPGDRVLDPGCGDGVFLEAACCRLRELGAAPQRAAQNVYGVELDEGAAESGRVASSKANGGCQPQLVVADFFDVRAASEGAATSRPVPVVDAVVGNPPYIRYHHFRGELRKKALRQARAQGVEVSGLTSSWAPYIVHATSFLSRTGRMAVVLPAELLQVDYAASVRRFLSARFNAIDLIVFRQRAFPGVQEEVVLVLADSTGERGGIRALEVHDASELEDVAAALQTAAPRNPPFLWGKWTALLVHEQVEALLRDLLTAERVVPLSAFAQVDIGAVTGNRDFFLLADDEARFWGIDSKWLVPVVCKARSVRGARFRRTDWVATNASGAKSHMLLVPPTQNIEPCEALTAYLRHGEASGANATYKCRSRSPWYSVPGARRPDAFLTYMSARFPRLAVNEYGAYNTNTLHGVLFQGQPRVLQRALVASYYNTLTQLSTELVGRSYGGGVLKLETKEGEALLLPNVSAISTEARQRLARLLPAVDKWLRKGGRASANPVDDMVLEELLGLAPEQIRTLRSARDLLQERRLARGRRASSP